MKGKQLIKKITRPSVVFGTGAFIVLFMIAIFVHLHVVTVNRIQEINENIEAINNEIFLFFIENKSSEEIPKELLDHLDTLSRSKILMNLLHLYEIDLDSGMYRVKSRDDIENTYFQIKELKKLIHVHSIKREESFRNLYLLIVVTIISMILFLGINQYEYHKKSRLERIRNDSNNMLYDQLEKERSLIAFELHDDIAQKLAIIKQYFHNKNSIDEHTVLMGDYSSEVIKRVRYLSRMLKAPDNPDVSFKDYLETLFSDFNVLSDFKLNRRTVGLNALMLQPSAALHIYRIIQEILTNSRIHSEATEIDLLLVYSHPTLNIKYKDNGKGFDPYLVYRKGIGLDSIKYRLEILNGEYQLNSAEGEGTDISIDIPVELCETS